MRHLIYVVHDQKAGAFLQPWFLPTDGMATRCFADCVNDPKHNFGRHPADYTLFCIGDFQDSNAEISTEGGRRSLGNGVEFVALEIGGPDLFDKEGFEHEVRMDQLKEQGDGEAT